MHNRQFFHADMAQGWPIAGRTPQAPVAERRPRSRLQQTGASMSNLLDYKPSAEPKSEPTYRAFRLNRDGGIDFAEIIQARSDDEAIGKACVMVNGHGIELWERARFLRHFPTCSGAD